MAPNPGMRGWIGGLALSALLAPPPAHAAWPTDSSVNFPVAVEPGNQTLSASVADNYGGAIIAWVDARSLNPEIYVQRVLGTGSVPASWPLNGLRVTPGLFPSSDPVVVADGLGGVIVAWDQDIVHPVDSDWSVWAHHVRSDGSLDPAWPVNGRGISVQPGNQRFPVIIPDGAAGPFGTASGAFIAWRDSRNGLTDVYAQHLRADGTIDPAWADDGNPIAIGPGYQDGPVLAPAGGGGFIIAWNDDSGSEGPSPRARHVLTNGTFDPAWPAGGLSLTNGAGWEVVIDLVPDGSGGAIALLLDHRTSVWNVYAQRVRASGIVDPAWPPDGCPVSTLAGIADFSGTNSPTLVSDGAGGAVVTWVDYRDGANAPRVYAQHVLSTGVVDAAWPSTGRRLRAAATSQDNPHVISDGAGGAIVTWVDQNAINNYDVYAQRVTANGALHPGWGDGRAIANAVGFQSEPSVASDAIGGAIIAFTDSRTNYPDIYAQRILANGQLGGGVVDAQTDTPTAIDLAPRRNPARGGVLSVRFALPSAAPAELALFDISGRRIASHEVGSLGAGPHAIDLGAGLRLAPGVYVVRLTQGGVERAVRVALLD